MGVFKKMLGGPAPEPDDEEPTKTSEFFLAIAAEEEEIEQRSGFATAQAAIDRAIEERNRQKQAAPAAEAAAQASALSSSPTHRDSPFGPPPLIERRSNTEDPRPPGSPDRRLLGPPVLGGARTFGKRVT